MKSVVCRRCKNECSVEGEYPKFFSWCDECGDYPEGFDCLDYATEWISGYTDYVYDMRKEGE